MPNRNFKTLTDIRNGAGIIASVYATEDPG